MVKKVTQGGVGPRKAFVNSMVWSTGVGISLLGHISMPLSEEAKDCYDRLERVFSLGQTMDSTIVMRAMTEADAATMEEDNIHLEDSRFVLAASSLSLSSSSSDVAVGCRRRPSPPPSPLSASFRWRIRRRVRPSPQLCSCSRPQSKRLPRRTGSPTVRK
eukprot:1019424-Pyramimonas_sp.AAC.1